MSGTVVVAKAATPPSVESTAKRPASPDGSSALATSTSWFCTMARPRKASTVPTGAEAAAAGAPPAPGVWATASAAQPASVTPAAAPAGPRAAPRATPAASRTAGSASRLPAARRERPRP